MKTAIEKTLLAVLFAVGEPIAPERIAAALDLDAAEVRRLLDRIAESLEEQAFPLQVQNLGGQYQLTTRPADTEAIRRVLNERRNTPLSQAALEVLAAVAYNQPVTRAYIEQVRGVDSSSTVAALVEKGLLEEAGRLELPGRPIAYRTTAHFLRTFGLHSLEDLPAAAPLPEDAEALLSDDGTLDGQLSFDE